MELDTVPSEANATPALKHNKASSMIANFAIVGRKWVVGRTERPSIETKKTSERSMHAPSELILGPGWHIGAANQNVAIVSSPKNTNKLYI
jgi:hypothetical protein